MRKSSWLAGGACLLACVACWALIEWGSPGAKDVATLCLVPIGLATVIAGLAIPFDLRGDGNGRKGAPAKCFKCERGIGLAVRDDDEDLVWDMPSGAVVFRGGNNYGSTLYDAMVDGIYVELIVCDECLRRGKALLREDETGHGILSNPDLLNYPDPEPLRIEDAWPSDEVRLFRLSEGNPETDVYLFSTRTDEKYLRSLMDEFDHGGMDYDDFVRVWQKGRLEEITGAEQVPEEALDTIPFCAEARLDYESDVAGWLREKEADG